MGKLSCWTCGKSLKKRRFANSVSREYCDGCYQIKLDNENNYSKYRMINMHENALKMIEKQPKVNLSEYKEASDVVLEFALNDTKKFASSHEMAVAMHLIKNMVKTKVQVPILRYRVDFVLPDYQVVLEIDGKQHDYNLLFDSMRDTEITAELNKQGGKWEVVRIPTKHIEANIEKLLDAIIILSDERRQLRIENNGFLPSRNNRRDDAKIRSITNKLYFQKP